MKGLQFDLETIADPLDGLPMHLTVRGDLADPADTLLKLRALQSFDQSPARYAIQRTVRCEYTLPARSAMATAQASIVTICSHASP